MTPAQIRTHARRQMKQQISGSAPWVAWSILAHQRLPQAAQFEKKLAKEALMLWAQSAPDQHLSRTQHATISKLLMNTNSQFEQTHTVVEQVVQKLVEDQKWDLTDSLLNNGAFYFHKSVAFLDTLFQKPVSHWPPAGHPVIGQALLAGGITSLLENLNLRLFSLEVAAVKPSTQPSYCMPEDLTPAQQKISEKNQKYWETFVMAMQFLTIKHTHTTIWKETTEQLEDTMFKIQQHFETTATSLSPDAMEAFSKLRQTFIELPASLRRAALMDVVQAAQPSPVAPGRSVF